MNSCLTSVLPFPEYHVTSTINTSWPCYLLWLSIFLFVHLATQQPRKEGISLLLVRFRVFFIIITIVTMKIGKIGSPQSFESHEKKNYFKWWMHLFLSLNKDSLLHGSFPFCYRYLVSGTISNHETLICSTYVSMILFIVWTCFAASSS